MVTRSHILQRYRTDRRDKWDSAIKAQSDLKSNWAAYELSGNTELTGTLTFKRRLEDADKEARAANDGFTEARRCEWFGRSGKLPLPHAWPNGVAFKRWDSSDLLDSESFLLEVHDSDLTPSGLASRTTSPRLTSEFVRRLRQFATQHELVAAE